MLASFGCATRRTHGSEGPPRDPAADVPDGPAADASASVRVSREGDHCATARDCAASSAILVQVYFNAGLAYWLNRVSSEIHCVAAPSALIGASNFFELAVAAAVSLFGLQSGAALAIVVGVLIEVPVMLSVVHFTMKTHGLVQPRPRGETSNRSERLRLSLACIDFGDGAGSAAQGAAESCGPAYCGACPPSIRLLRCAVFMPSEARRSALGSNTSMRSCNSPDETGKLPSATEASLTINLDPTPLPEFFASDGRWELTLTSTLSRSASGLGTHSPDRGRMRTERQRHIEIGVVESSLVTVMIPRKCCRAEHRSLGRFLSTTTEVVFPAPGNSELFSRLVGSGVRAVTPFRNTRNAGTLRITTRFASHDSSFAANRT